MVPVHLREVDIKMRINPNHSPNLSPLRNSQRLFEEAIKRITSGRQINRAGDDPAGLAISQIFRAQIRGLQQASRNSAQAVNIAQTAESGLSETGNILSRMRELAVQASSDGLTDSDRDSINQEFTQLRSEVSRIANSTEHNGTSLLDGSFSAQFQVGANNNASDQLSLQVGDATASGLSLSTADLSNVENARGAIDQVDAAVDSVNQERTNLGVFQNRIETTISNLDQMTQNISQAESTIRDANLALEAVRLVSGQIRNQAGLAATAHQNISRQNVLNLIRSS